MFLTIQSGISLRSCNIFPKEVELAMQIFLLSFDSLVSTKQQLSRLSLCCSYNLTTHTCRFLAVGGLRYLTCILLYRSEKSEWTCKPLSSGGFSLNFDFPYAFFCSPRTQAYVQEGGSLRHVLLTSECHLFSILKCEFLHNV